MRSRVTDPVRDPNDPATGPSGRRRRVLLWIIGGVAVLVLVALAILWLQRKTIATRVVDRTLAAKNVPARYRITDLGLGRQRLTNVVVGDPADPDLVADWVETRTTIGLHGAHVTGIRAGHVRLRGRLVDGHVSLGTIDRLLPPSSGKPFALPAIGLQVADGRMRLLTPAGVVGLKLSGEGRLNDGFDGDLALVADRLSIGGCVMAGLRGAVAIHITDAAPALDGPVRLTGFDCAGTSARDLRTDLRAALDPTLASWRGSARVAVAQARTNVGGVDGISGTIGFDGSARSTQGHAVLSSEQFMTSMANGRSLGLLGDYEVSRSGTSFAGRMLARDVAVAPSRLAVLRRADRAGAGTPLGPIIRRIAAATIAVGRSFDAAAELSFRSGENGGVTVSQATLDAASGARMRLRNADLRYAWSGGVALNGTLAIQGGGWPDATVRLDQPEPGVPVTGVAAIEPYVARDARVALTPIRFTTIPGGSTRIETSATLSGPLAGGRVDAITLPLTAVWGGVGQYKVDSTCVPVGFDRLAISGLILERSRLRVCPIDGALVQSNRGRLGGGARLGAVRLGGRLGRTPITITAEDAAFRLANTRFTVDTLAASIGAGKSMTRLSFARLDGSIGGGIAGTFAGGGGQIGQVPLILSAAAGDWSLRAGALRLKGVLRVADAAGQPRFNPLVGRDVALALVDNRITATGALVEPTKGIRVADVEIVHALDSGRGAADLAVPSLVFTREFQPDLLTRLTFGVVADVRGTIHGQGHIAWNPDTVISTGSFTTPGTDLAAAFGPVTGLAGTIEFTDLLALESAPGQTLTIQSINPGIAVENGVVRYQLFPDSRVLVQSGRWPFAGGALTLDPTLLDFSQPSQRRLTFRVDHLVAAQFLQQFDFKNLNATGIFDGVLPMVFDDQGGRIDAGSLVVRSGGGTIAYVGEISQKDLGTWGNLAFQSLKSLRYRSLAIGMNGPLAGEMVTDVRFAGISQGAGAKSNFLIRRLQKLPIRFNIHIRAPFRGLIDSAASFHDPSRLVQRNLKALLDEQNRRTNAAEPAQPVQPPASRKVP